ncbi:MAG: hypothetical protein CL923_02275 [Deltaproteobacteria bacterium]|jgi:hypothetical protein|nr:hypothetical protein [Deltaproteobacteria bacterium]MDP7158632.1 hypothetical protein [SAR324 cluster bacterium]MDP7317645.1 hypothetical protein [SAR324 cluster bacterium]
MIQLTPHAIDHPIKVTQEEYDQLVCRTENGWSQCESREECLAKLHYLRHGLKQGKINEPTFQEREKLLVLNWWRRAL